jgi:collagen type I/II/III/V/XI/XXIV/XXVII alpha
LYWLDVTLVDCTRHPRPETVWPIRIERGAFRESAPVRDLFVSPDHAVLVNSVLIPVKLLINGTSIVQVKRQRVKYYHVELPEHAVIPAERLPVASHLDDGDRANFGNSGEPAAP